MPVAGFEKTIEADKARRKDAIPSMGNRERRIPTLRSESGLRASKKKPA